MVKPPASTGKENINKNPVINIDQVNKLISLQRPNLPIRFVLTIIVVLKFNEPNIELTPATCKENMAKSVLKPSWAIFPLSGG